MTRMEALSVAPPGVLLPCIQVTQGKINLWVNCVSSTRLIESLEERLQAGYIPLVQASSYFRFLSLKGFHGQHKILYDKHLLIFWFI